jgi:hypothetical protein
VKQTYSGGCQCRAVGYVNVRCIDGVDVDSLKVVKLDRRSV